MVAKGIDLKKYSNINVESYRGVKRFADGRINTFKGITKYNKVRSLTKKLFKNSNFFDVAPHFFEIHKGIEDRGIVVDSKKLEIRIEDDKNLNDAFNLYRKFRENNLGYKIVREADN